MFPYGETCSIVGLTFEHMLVPEFTYPGRSEGAGVYQLSVHYRPLVRVPVASSILR